MTVPNVLKRCRRCGYALVRGTCPICDGKQIGGLESIKTIVRRVMRHIKRAA